MFDPPARYRSSGGSPFRYEPVREKTNNLGSEQARSLKFEEEVYYQCSENKGADKARS